jgi:hypothetical protein
MNQQAEVRMSQMPERTPEDGRLKRKMEDKDMRIALNHATKCCYTCEEEGQQQDNVLQMQGARTLCEPMPKVAS